MGLVRGGYEWGSLEYGLLLSLVGIGVVLLGTGVLSLLGVS